VLEQSHTDSAGTPSGAAIGLRAQAVDRAELQALDRLRSRMMAYLRHVIRDPVERRVALFDVYSEVLALARDHKATWPLVLRVLRRIAREEWHRSREVCNDRVIDQLPNDNDADDRRAHRLALWAWEDAAMRQLTALQRGALELHVMDNLNDREIAALLGGSRASVRILRATAKKRLRALIRRGVVPRPPYRDEEVHSAHSRPTSAAAQSRSPLRSL
jgi:DNA-directed RNA polymerase specialized sigma24 family protein